ncbi:hypothetical protein AYI68_g3935 [Smittium mucronatum]|uniref:DNA methylase N-4/N-6 domain-containing protein n=1 Tax=Smittium mucronatum TaxID=133383 RepID=A0A1R0GYH3_9FUNG|nr:hypothetical protein AYI68_g3935 [Smittium mucronatum]
MTSKESDGKSLELKLNSRSDFEKTMELTSEGDNRPADFIEASQQAKTFVEPFLEQEIKKRKPSCIEVDQVSNFFEINSENQKKAVGVGSYIGDVEDYLHKTYFTRDSCLISFKPSMEFGIGNNGRNILNNRPSFLSPTKPVTLLSSYGPTKSTLWSLPVVSTYFNVSGRAPRWATHSGTDYHGTWLPQSVRRSILRFSEKKELILSNFLGRGTDMIESFLLMRKCIGVDINHTAVTLSKFNTSFVSYETFLELNKFSDCSKSFEDFENIKPLIFNGDSRDLGAITGPKSKKYFSIIKNSDYDEYQSGTFDYVLSHPPYKDCVSYSSNIIGDLSRFPDPLEFQKEMKLVIDETYRLLKKNRFVTLGIGDNRFQCFYVTVGFQLIRNYIENGFDIIELIIKKQKNCQAYGLGTRLCTQFDFLLFTHEYIATFRKVPKSKNTGYSLVEKLKDIPHEKSDNISQNITSNSYFSELPAARLSMMKDKDYNEIESSDFNEISKSLGFLFKKTKQPVRSLPTDPKKVIMGTVWTFKLKNKNDRSTTFSFSNLCVGKILKRFGLSFSNWELLEFEPISGLKNPDLRIGDKDVNIHKEIKVVTHFPYNHGDHFKTCNWENSNIGDSPKKKVGSPKKRKKIIMNENQNETYEQRRQRIILKNREKLASLGLITELGEKSDDVPYLSSLNLFKKENSERPENTITKDYQNRAKKSKKYNEDDTDYSLFSGSDQSRDSDSDTGSDISIQETTVRYDDDFSSKTSLISSQIESKPTSLIIIPHIEASKIFPSASKLFSFKNKQCYENANINVINPKRIINNYRKLLVQAVLRNYKRLVNSGQIVIGVQDIRDPINGELWPMGMLVSEDINKSVSDKVLRLKEMIVAVPEGFKNTKDSRYYFENQNGSTRDMSKLSEVKCVIDLPNIEIDHLQIVHAYYLVFMKLQ